MHDLGVLCNEKKSKLLIKKAANQAHLKSLSTEMQKREFGQLVNIISKSLYLHVVGFWELKFEPFSKKKWQ